MRKNDYLIIITTTLLATITIFLGLSSNKSDNILSDLLMNLGVSIFTIGLTVYFVDRFRINRQSRQFETAQTAFFDSVTANLQAILHQIIIMWSRGTDVVYPYQLEQAKQYTDEGGMKNYIELLNRAVIKIVDTEDYKFLDKFRADDIASLYDYSENIQTELMATIELYSYCLADLGLRDQLVKMNANLNNLNFGAWEVCTYKNNLNRKPRMNRQEYKYIISELLCSYRNLIVRYHPRYQKSLNIKIAGWLKEYIVGDR